MYLRGTSTANELELLQSLLHRLAVGNGRSKDRGKEDREEESEEEERHGVLASHLR